MAIDDLTLSLTIMFAPARLAARCCRSRSLAAPEAGHGEYHALLLIVRARHGRARGRDEPGHRCSSASSCCRSRSTCCARRSCGARLARVGAQVPDHRLGRLGDAALRARVRLRRDGRDRLRRDRRRRRRASTRRRAAADRRRADRRPGSRSRRRWRRSTSGRPTSTRARRRRSPRSWRSPPRRRRSGSCMRFSTSR